MNTYLRRLFPAVLLFLVGLLTGCVESTAVRGVEVAKDLHDKQLASGEVLACGSSLRAMLDRYAGEPARLKALMRFCGYSSFLELMSLTPDDLK